MTSDTIERLRRRGLAVSPDDLERAVRLAITERHARLAEPPARELTAAEVDVLEAGGFDLTVRREADEPIVRTIAAYAAMIDGALTTGAAARRLGVATSRVRQRLGERSLYGIMPDTEWLLPEFQFDGERVLPGLAPVVQALDRQLHPLTVDRFFTTPDAELPGSGTTTALSPRDWLRSGHPPEAVARLAAEL